MQTFKCGLICLMLVLFSKTAHSDIGTACPNGNECGTGERCTGPPAACECDTGNSYEAGLTQTTKCFLAKNLGIACTVAGENDECMLGNGGTGAICSATPDCVCDTGYKEDASTCKRDCGDPPSTTGYTVTPGAGEAGKLEGATASVACVTGYSGTPADIVCQAGGSWVTPTGCTIDDCGTPPSTSGYDVTVGGGGAETSYGDTAVVACATAYTGTAAPISCQAGGTWETPTGCTIDAKNLNQNCDIDDQCVAGDGGPGTVCDTTCKKDCGSPTNSTGYTLTTGGDASATYEGAEATVTCATGYAGTPSPATVACQADGTWAASSGCAIDAKNLGENCNIDDQCVAGDGGSGAVCDTTCKIGNGASEIRQRFSFVVLIGVLFLALV